MKRRKNAIYTGYSERFMTNLDRDSYLLLLLGKRVRTRTGDDTFAKDFYKSLNFLLRPDDEIEIIPRNQVDPTHSAQEQLYIVADYCVRKIWPEVTSLFRWGDELTLQLRALAPIVDKETAQAAFDATIYNVFNEENPIPFDEPNEEEALIAAHSTATFANRIAEAATNSGEDVADSGEDVAEFVYNALRASIETSNEAAYDRIIAFTNEMLESL